MHAKEVINKLGLWFNIYARTPCTSQSPLEAKWKVSKYRKPNRYQ